MEELSRREGFHLVIPKVDPERFCQAFDTMRLVEEGAIRPIRPLVGRTIGSGDSVFTIEDSPVTRMVEAVRSVFPESDEGAAACLRMYCLIGLIATPGDLQHFFMRDAAGEISAVHIALLQAMAQVEMTRKGSPDPEAILELARTLLPKAES